MSRLDRLRAKLAGHPELETSDSENEITIYARDESGFDVSVSEGERGFIVSFEGWHQNVKSPAEALDCVAFGLSDSCRLAITYRGDRAVGWAVETQADGDWVEYSKTGMLLSAFWKPKRVEYRQNQILSKQNPDSS